MVAPSTGFLLRCVAGLCVAGSVLMGVLPTSARWRGYSVSTSPANSTQNSASGCNGCHSGGTAPTVSLILTGSPTYLETGDTVGVRVKVQHNNAAQDYAGFNAFTDDGTLSVSTDAWVKTASGDPFYPDPAQSEATHSNRKGDNNTPRAASNDNITDFYFNWTMPNSVPAGGLAYINAWGNSVNGTATADDYSDANGPLGDRGAPISSAVSIAVCADADGDGNFWGHANCPGSQDCDDDDEDRYYGNTEICDNKDNDCDGVADDGLALSTCGVGACANTGTTCSPASCTPLSPSAEVCDNKDNDCNGVIDNGVALSTCGVGECARTGTTCFANSCTPGSPSAELCDNKDNDCNGVVDNGCDADGDNYCTSLSGSSPACDAGGDCDDSSDKTYPGAPELCDGEDNDCDGSVDEGCDADGDDYCTDVIGSSPACPNGGGDCNDADDTVHPSATELCNNVDDDCNGTIDNGCDADGDNYCTSVDGSSPACPLGGGDCNDNAGQTHPNAPEVCDGLDNDCNGPADDNIAAITCGVGECQRVATACVNGVPQGCTPGTPAAVETCNGLDNDCNGVIDNGCDDDSDGYCDDTLGYAAGAACTPGDCDDSPTGGGVSYPGAAELCDGEDNDCNGRVDNGCDADGDDYCTSVIGSSPACSRGGGDCDDSDGSNFPGNTELCDGAENNCNAVIDDGCDADGDDFCEVLIGSSPRCSQGGDCDDSDPNNFPGNPEVCDGADNDCNATRDDGCDDDGDGYCDPGMTRLPGAACAATDCDDSDPNNFPFNAEACDGQTNDCDGEVDEGCDDDGDGFCDAALAYSAGAACTPGDCDDSVLTGSASNPDATEICDDLDNDCDTETDDGCDDDGDGFCDENMTVVGTPAVCSSGTGDCDDTVGATYPGAPEVCDGADNDCDGDLEEGLPFATCGVGVCKRTGTGCDVSTCTPGTPLDEICDGLDNDCDGTPDNGLPLAKCGVGECATTGSSCHPSTCQPLPSEPERCDGLDNDCDGTIDDGCDDDGDGYCDAALPLTNSPVCPNGGGDCDDDLADTYPGAREICDDKDNDCNGDTDDAITEPTCGVGACNAPATACNAGVPEGCTPGEPAPEECDGVDNDCNGRIDDDVPPISCGVGECAVEMPGCANGVAGECVPAEPTDEECDGLDNDCDELIDEGDLCGDGICVAGRCETELSFEPEPSFGGNDGLSSTAGAAPGGAAGYGGSAEDVLPPSDPVGVGGSSGGGRGDDGGCSCRTAGAPIAPSPAVWMLSGLVGLAFIRRRYRLAERVESRKSVA